MTTENLFLMAALREVPLAQTSVGVVSGAAVYMVLLLAWYAGVAWRARLPGWFAVTLPVVALLYAASGPLDALCRGRLLLSPAWGVLLSAFLVALSHAPEPPTGRMSKAVTSEFALWAWGLGYSIVEVHVREHGLVLRNLVLATPSSSGRVDLRIALSLRRIESKRALHPLAVLAPRALLEGVLERVAMRAFAADVQQDFDVWNHKTILERPALADGDGPVGLYRRWARQFYPVDEGEQVH